MRPTALLSAIVLIAWCGSDLAWAQDEGEGADPGDGGLTDLSLEELLSLDLKVTSVSKREETLTDAAAAIYAITDEEIRRTGHTSIPEALRVVPGMHVARFDGSAWAISSRSWNGRFNNKMLVLMDGRSGYTPLFGGVFWDVQDTLLDDVDRIEVIRGPGGTLWGANAVNGVINVSTKPADRTQGLLASAGGGIEERAYGAVRYGGKVGSALAYRVYGKFADRDALADPDGRPTSDAWRAWRGGFRTDWNPGRTTLTLQGDAYGNDEETLWVRDTLIAPDYEELVEGETPATGMNALARWSVRLGEAEASKLQVQTYYDRTTRDDIRGGEIRDTQDLDVQYSTVTGAWNAVIVGGGLRSTTSAWDDKEAVSMDPDKENDLLVNAYVQDEVRLMNDVLRIVVGSKFEHNDFTGFEYQPSARLTVRPVENQTFWGALSRSVRTPTRISRDSEVAFGNFPGEVPVYLVVVGNENLDSEEILSSELGYRVQFAKRVSLDLATFYNDYRGIITVNPANAGTPFVDENGNTKIPVPWTNEEGASVRGAELAGRWNVTPQWVMAASYTFTDAALGPNSQDAEKLTPRNMASIRWYMNVHENLEWNIAGYWTDPTGAGDQRVEALMRLDTGFTLRVGKRYDIAVWGQNLFNEQHPEIKSRFLFPSTEVQRSFYARLTTRFF